MWLDFESFSPNVFTLLQKRMRIRFDADGHRKPGRGSAGNGPRAQLRENVLSFITRRGQPRAASECHVFPRSSEAPRAAAALGPACRPPPGRHGRCSCPPLRTPTLCATETYSLKPLVLSSKFHLGPFACSLEIRRFIVHNCEEEPGDFLK